MQQKFTSGEANLKERVQMANDYKLNGDFANVLKSETRRFSKSMPKNQLPALHYCQVDDEVDHRVARLKDSAMFKGQSEPCPLNYRGIFTQSNEKALQRGEKIETLVGGREELAKSADSSSFQKSRMTLQQKTVIGLVILLVVLVILR